MTQRLIETTKCAFAFENVSQADGAVRNLQASGFSKDQLAVVCPPKFQSYFANLANHTEPPHPEAENAMAVGGATGAALGGLALAATVLTGGAAGLIGGAMLVGGGAIAGAFSSLVISNGYEQETDDQCKQAIKRGQIVVGVELAQSDNMERVNQARQILKEGGGTELQPSKD